MSLLQSCFMVGFCCNHAAWWGSMYFHIATMISHAQVAGVSSGLTGTWPDLTTYPASEPLPCMQRYYVLLRRHLEEFIRNSPSE
jgi:hypothetical protein